MPVERVMRRSIVLVLSAAVLVLSAAVLVLSAAVLDLGLAEVARKDAKTQRELDARRVISRRRRDTEIKAAKFGR